MRKRLLFHVEAALSGRDDTRADDVRRTAARLADDCGCAMGGAFLWVALLVGAPTLVITQHARPLAFVGAIAAVFAAAGLGKAVGIGLATLRLLLLVRRLGSVAATERGPRHVHLH
jgi:hypothetical protein